jgi:SAM-dependent methyltransferase
MKTSPDIGSGWISTAKHILADRDRQAIGLTRFHSRVVVKIPMTLKDQMEEIYRELPPEKIPWNLPKPSSVFVEMVVKQIEPGRAIDLGCGAGNLSVWLAGRGFEVTGIDFSEGALNLARKLAEEKGLTCTFLARDLLGDLSDLDGKFDFACDWELLHHVLPDDRPRYLENVQRLLRPGGRYLSACFSESDPGFGGEGKVRTTRLGTELYFSSEEELRELYKRNFSILQLETREIEGKYEPHQAVVALLQRP